MNATAVARRGSLGALWSSVGVGALMVVAALGIVVWQAHWAQSVRWEQSKVVPLQFRGEGDAKPAFTEEQLNGMVARLQDLVDESYRELYRERRKAAIRLRARPDFVMGATAQELPGERVMVTLRAVEVKGEAGSREWSVVLSGASGMDAQGVEFGRKVAVDMLAMAKL